MRRRLRHDRPDEATELLATEQTARQALAEMRRMLGLLRADEDGASLSPQPGLDQVGALVEQVGDAGLAVELDVSGEPGRCRPASTWPPNASPRRASPTSCATRVPPARAWSCATATASSTSRSRTTAAGRVPSATARATGSSGCASA